MSLDNPFNIYWFDKNYLWFDTELILLISWYKNNNDFPQVYTKLHVKTLKITTLEDPKLQKSKQEIQLAAKTVGSISSRTSTNAHISSEDIE